MATHPPDRAAVRAGQTELDEFVDGLAGLADDPLDLRPVPEMEAAMDALAETYRAVAVGRGSWVPEAAGDLLAAVRANHVPFTRDVAAALFVAVDHIRATLDELEPAREPVCRPARSLRGWPRRRRSRSAALAGV